VSYPETLTQKLRRAKNTPGEVRREGEGRRGGGADGMGEGGVEDGGSGVGLLSASDISMEVIAVLKGP
jgi:hypothetical protein